MADIQSSQLWSDLQKYAEERLKRYRTRLESPKVTTNVQLMGFYQGKISELKRLQLARNITEIFDDDES